MLIDKKFNTLSLNEYFFYIDNYRKYKDFNTLGLYRSILENELLSLDEKFALREYAHKVFRKSFDFLQLKDPKLFIEVEYLGQELTKGDEERIWTEVKRNQKRILADKRIKHRNFGDYSKHNCGRDNCIWNGLMIRQGSWLSYGNMQFDSDRNKIAAKAKSYMRKTNRKRAMQIIKNELDSKN